MFPRELAIRACASRFADTRRLHVSLGLQQLQTAGLLARTGSKADYAERIQHTSQNFAPIWLPHCPAWMCTISRILPGCRSKLPREACATKGRARRPTAAYNGPGPPFPSRVGPTNHVISLCQVFTNCRNSAAGINEYTGHHEDQGQSHIRAPNPECSVHAS